MDGVGVGAWEALEARYGDLDRSSKNRKPSERGRGRQEKERDQEASAAAPVERSPSGGKAMNKADLYSLVDELPESEAHAAARYLEYLRDRAGEQAPAEEFDEEPLSEEEAAALARGTADFEAGRVTPYEEYLKKQTAE
ncbi:MAG: hypothetical protein FJX76_08135 [Armatimonadetes bacterium]|nr:hypothetical protein [Armatimonadota bacterium]